MLSNSLFLTVVSTGPSRRLWHRQRMSICHRHSQAELTPQITHSFYTNWPSCRAFDIFPALRAETRPSVPLPFPE